MSPHPLYRALARTELAYSVFEGETDVVPDGRLGTLLDAFPRHVVRAEKRGGRAEDSPLPDMAMLDERGPVR